MRDVVVEQRVELPARRIDRLRAAGTIQNVTIVGLVAFLLGSARLGTPSIWLDESFTARAIGQPYPDLLLNFHWVFYSLEKPWTAIAGTSEWALRAPAVAGAMISCALLVVLAARLFDRWTGLLAGLLLATNPFFVQWSQQARGYTFLGAASILAALLLVRALDRGTRGAWLAYGFALSLVLMMHPVSGLALLPAQAVLLYRRREQLGQHVLAAAVPVVVLGMTWTATVAIYTTGEGSENTLDFPSADSVARALTKNAGAAGLGLVLAIVGLWMLRRAHRAELADWLATWAFIPFVLVLCASVLKPVFLDRYLIVTAPAFALLAAVALRGLAPRLRAPVAAVVVAATAFGLMQWYAKGWDGGNWHGEDWWPALETIYDERGHRGPVLVIPFFAHSALRYYDVEWRWKAPDTESVWALWWSDDRHHLSATERRELGLDGYRVVESLSFGWRLRAERWTRESGGAG